MQLIFSTPISFMLLGITHNLSEYKYLSHLRIRRISMFDGKIAFIGAGAIAEALVAGLLKSGFVESEQIAVANREDLGRLNHLHLNYGVLTTTNKELAIAGTKIVILAVKPKDLTVTIDDCRNFFNEEQVIVSLAAGVSIQTIKNLIGRDNLHIVRAMPTTSSFVLKSATALAFDHEVAFEKVQLIEQLFKQVGITAKVEEEELHAMTGLFGSGPAYIYYIVEQFERAAMSLGIHRDIAKPFIQQTLVGAVSMLQETNNSPLTLRKKVTSPNGTTQAGISILEDNDVSNSFQRCFLRATERSEEIEIEYKKWMKSN